MTITDPVDHTTVRIASGAMVQLSAWATAGELRPVVEAVGGYPGADRVWLYPSSDELRTLAAEMIAHADQLDTLNRHAGTPALPLEY